MIFKLTRPVQPINVSELFPQLLLVVFLSGTMRGYSAPYFNLYLDEQQFSGTLIGVVLSAAALLEIVMIPLLSNWADRTRTHRRLFRAMSLAYALACVLMLAFPVTAVLFLAMIVAHFTLHSTFMFAMQLAFTRMEQHGKSLFGRVRSVSAGGFMVANMTAGMIYGLGGYAALLWAAAAGGLGSLGLSGAMPENTADKPTQTTSVKRSRRLYPVLAAQFFVTMGLRSAFAFWLLYFQEHLGMTTGQIALLITIAAILEIPWFMALDTPLRRGRQASMWMYVLGSAGFGLHWLLIGSAGSFIAVLLLLVPRGLMFAMWNLSLLVHINQISHPSNVSTNQALAQITVPSLAALISSAPMGYVYDHFPPMVFFSIACGLMVFGAGLMLAGQVFVGQDEAEIQPAVPSHT